MSAFDIDGWLEDAYGSRYEPGDWEPDDDDLIDGVGFAREGSALRAETEDNPRDRPCPTCETENVLTRIDEERGYQCDRCADAAERGF